MTREEILNTPEIVDFMIDKSVIAESKMKLHKRLDELCKLAIKALEQDPCEDEEYEKNLNELKEQIFKEGNTLISKQDLLERFVEIDNEYKNSHWNLLQILANIDILIGKEPCEDCISRQAVLDIIEKEEFKGDAISEIEKLPSVKPTQNISIQITEREKYGRFN